MTHRISEDQRFLHKINTSHVSILGIFFYLLFCYAQILFILLSGKNGISQLPVSESSKDE
jgi:hypothetical protein